MSESAISVRDRKIDVADLPNIAEQIVEDYELRKKNRKDLEAQWKEVDRQLRMEPELTHKQLANGNLDPNKAWMPETELPHQAQTLEMLTADCRRLLFPTNGEWFLARAALTEDYLQKFRSVETPIAKERGRFEGAINQDNADRLVQGVLGFYHEQYDLFAHLDQINAEALSYSFGVGRLVKVKKRILGHTMKGRPTMREIPMLLPRSAKHVYLDDSAQAILHEGQEVGPNTLLYRSVRLADLKIAAQTDPSYVRSQLNRLETDKTGHVDLVELEGDLVYHNGKETAVVRDVLITAARGKQGNNSVYGVIRHRPLEEPSYLVFDYHRENTTQRYGSSPLLKGFPVNRIAAQIMNRLIESAQLSNAPPVGFPRDDPVFAAEGGPQIYPNAMWETTEDLNVYHEVGGEPAAFFQIFAGLQQMYADVTGVNRPRLGAETKSHTTAFAKDAELSQGAVRTVDYIDSTLKGPLTRFLEMEYRIALKTWHKEVVFIDAWNEFVELQRAHLPEIVKFKALGANSPAEDQAAMTRKLNAIQLALQIDTAAVQLGREPRLDHGKIVEKVLHDGGFQNVDQITTDEASNVIPIGTPGVVSEPVL